MIAREQKLIVDQQHHVAGGMAWRGNGHDAGCQFTRLFAVDDDLGFWLRVQLVAMIMQRLPKWAA